MFEGIGLEQMKKHVVEEQVVKKKADDGVTGHTPTADHVDTTEVDDIKKENARACTDLIHVLPSELKKVTSRAKSCSHQDVLKLQWTWWSRKSSIPGSRMQKTCRDCGMKRAGKE